MHQLHPNDRGRRHAGHTNRQCLPALKHSTLQTRTILYDWRLPGAPGASLQLMKDGMHSIGGGTSTWTAVPLLMPIGST